MARKLALRKIGSLTLALSTILLATQLSGCSPSAESQCEKFKQYFLESNQESSSSPAYPNRYANEFDEMPVTEDGISVTASIWFDWESRALDERLETDSYPPAKEWIAKRDAEERFTALRNIVSDDCAQTGIEAVADDYKSKFWIFDENLAQQFESCAAKLEEASLEPDGDLAEPILVSSLTVCENADAWDAAVHEFPEAFGVTRADGTEIDLMCLRYPDTRVCLSRE